MSQEYLQKLQRREVYAGNLNRSKTKNSYVQNIHVARQAEALERLESLQLRKKLNAISEPVREQLRQNYVRNLDVRHRHAQKQQFQSLSFFQEKIRERTEEQGLDYRKFSIGGTDEGLFERFYRIEPKKYMSQAQFIQVMRLVFGTSFSPQLEKKLVQLYMAFDMHDRDEMDWRAFLFLLVILMQVYKPCLEHLKLGYALFSSAGVLDYSCNEPLKLSQVKDMIQAPVILSNRAAVSRLIDDAWNQLIRTNMEALQVLDFEAYSSCSDIVAMKYIRRRNTPDDHNDTMLTFSMFLSLLTETDFGIHFEAASYYGKRDMRPHTYILEQEHYHPVIMDKIVPLRREIRCDNEADRFIEEREFRAKRQFWVKLELYVAKRRAARSAICDMFMMWFYQRAGNYFDRWRKHFMEEGHCINIQRVVRGYIGRKRKVLLRKLHKTAEKVQSLARQRAVEIKYQHKIKRRDWAVTEIQKIYRGFRERRRVQSIVEATFDSGMRKLKRQKMVWILNRQLRAAVRIQIMARRFLRRREAMRKMEKIKNEEYTTQMMEAHDMENYRKKLIYKAELEGWYAKRKEEYDRDTFVEGQTQAQVSKILSYRRRIQYAEKEARRKAQEEKEERAEAAEIELWLKKWDDEKKKRYDDRAVECRFALLTPETPQQKELKKELQKKIKDQIPLVLKRADRLKIPMEIPEAKQIATDEVIVKEQELELERVAKEMHDAATKAVAAKEEKRLKEIELEKARKKRKVKWAAKKIQSASRQFAARKVMRAKAYKRFEKKFDPESMAYYYLNLRSLKTQWTKPLCLGSYDIASKDHWVVLKDNDGDTYYYNPCTWAMQWEEPHRVVFCDICGPTGFAILLLSNDEKFYCEKHFNEKAAELIANHVLPRNIKFREFDGSVEESMNSNFKKMPEKNWQTHCIAFNKSLHQAGNANQDESDSDKDEKIVEKIFCSRCDTELATLNCVACGLSYCQGCFDRKHKHPPWTNHVTQAVKQPEPRKKLKKSSSSMSLKRRASLKKQISRITMEDDKDDEDNF